MLVQVHIPPENTQILNSFEVRIWDFQIQNILFIYLKTYPHLYHKVVNLVLMEVHVPLDDALQGLENALRHGAVATHVEVPVLVH